MENKKDPPRFSVIVNNSVFIEEIREKLDDFLMVLGVSLGSDEDDLNPILKKLSEEYGISMSSFTNLIYRNRLPETTSDLMKILSMMWAVPTLIGPIISKEDLDSCVEEADAQFENTAEDDQVKILNILKDDEEN